VECVFVLHSSLSHLSVLLSELLILSQGSFWICPQQLGELLPPLSADELIVGDVKTEEEIVYLVLAQFLLKKEGVMKGRIAPPLTHLFLDLELGPMDHHSGLVPFAFSRPGSLFLDERLALPRAPPDWLGVSRFIHTTTGTLLGRTRNLQWLLRLADRPSLPNANVLDFLTKNASHVAEGVLLQKSVDLTLRARTGWTKQGGLDQTGLPLEFALPMAYLYSEY